MSKSSVPPPIDRSKLKSFRDITNLSGRKTPQSARRYGIPRIPPNLIVKRIPEPSRDPFQLDEDQDRRNPNRQKQPTFKVMQIRRTKSSNIRGRRTLFVLYQYDHPIYSAKYKPIKISEYVPIFCGGEPHFKNQPQAVLLVANNNCDFSLRKDNKLGQELLTLQYRRFTTEGAHPRHLTAYFFGQNDDIPNKLENVDPEFRDDAWSVDLNTNEAMSSIKNCKLENDEHQPYVYIRKTQKEVLEIEIREEIDDINLDYRSINEQLMMLKKNLMDINDENEQNSSQCLSDAEDDFDYKNTEAFKAFGQYRVNELAAIATLLTSRISVHVSRDTKRKKSLLFKWFDENWEKILPFKDKIVCLDSSDEEIPNPNLIGDRKPMTKEEFHAAKVDVDD